MAAEIVHGQSDLARLVGPDARIYSMDLKAPSAAAWPVLVLLRIQAAVTEIDRDLTEGQGPS